MTEDVIELYDTFNTIGCPEDLIFGDFNNQPIPSTYYDLKNYYDDDGTPIDAEPADNKLVVDAFVQKDKNNNTDRLTSQIELPLTIFWKLKEWTEWKM